MSVATYKLHGLKLSYFTGKLEAYLQVKGVPFEFVDMDRAGFARCAKATGVAQMPALEASDGTWMTDTTPIIAQFEETFDGPSLRPQEPAAAFLSLLLEDLFDEWLWRPALYYRWAFKDDMRLMSAQIARTMLRDMKMPFRARQQFIKSRQKRVYLDEDGVTPTTAPLIEKLFLDTLDALEPIFAQRPFLFGERPCEADFGLFGPFMRHFSHDPTPHGIMRERAPQTLAWVARLWALRPDAASQAPTLTSAPDDLAPFLAMAADDYLPYLEANAAAVANGEKTVRYKQGGADWSVPSSPYRSACLNALREAFQRLPDDARGVVATRLGGSDLLAQPVSAIPAPAPSGQPTDRLWKRQAAAD